MQTTTKKLSKFTKKITYVDDMMIHNLVKYLVQTRLHLSDKNNKFLTNHLDTGLKFVLFISHRRNRVWTIFYKVVYHHIIYMCDFFVNLDDFFTVVCTGFHEVMVCTRYVPLFNTTNRTSWNS